MSQGREPGCSMHLAVLCVQQRVRVEPGRLAISSEPSTSSRWNAGDSRGRMEALMEQVPAPLQEVPSSGTHDRFARSAQEDIGSKGKRVNDDPFPLRR